MMNSSERNDIKSSLRKREFPFCARDALKKVEELLCQTTNLAHQSVKQLMLEELISELISEFIFNDVDRRGMRRKLTQIQELDLLQVICDHMLFEGTGNSPMRNLLFLALFPFQAVERIHFLIKLVSFAISTRNTPVLTATSVLLQYRGLSSTYSRDFVNKFVPEIYLLISADSSSVLDLPRHAPRFSANFLTSLTDIEGKSQISLPPVALLEVILTWLKSNPRLCTIALLDNLQQMLPDVTMMFPSPTPYIGLIKWCIWSHLDENSNSQIYTTLEQLILESLAICRSTVGIIHHDIISTKDLITLIPILATKGAAHPDRLKRSIESLVKIIRVALITNTLNGSKQDLRRHLQSLPYNEALDILVQDIAIVP
ncbi:uncharacterized protein C7orf26 homolog [Cimex lectularius]|uniref:Uncharacterized protein n=1 Tax=Cimex lectularius TaxID=79782 RepID=A0A8I6TL75_CIMLE|nr:uncharacterized protein C7orf26 homolog [Cimex lectularius]